MGFGSGLLFLVGCFRVCVDSVWFVVVLTCFGLVVVVVIADGVYFGLRFLDVAIMGYCSAL